MNHSLKPAMRCSYSHISTLRTLASMAATAAVAHSSISCCDMAFSLGVK